jgi:hypothetical protein
MRRGKSHVTIQISDYHVQFMFQTAKNFTAAQREGGARLAAVS